MSEKAQNIDSPRNDATAPSIATFVFEDCLKKPIRGLSVKVTNDSKIYVGETDENGLAITITDLQKNKEYKIFVKKNLANMNLRAR